MQSPVGVFKFCHLNKPDTKFKEEGEYNVNVAFDADDPAVVKMIAALDKLHARAGASAEQAFEDMGAKQKQKLAAKKITEATLMPYYEQEFSDYDDTPTGRIIMRFKTKASFTDRKTGKVVDKVVALIDGKGMKIPENKRPLVYAGTTGRIDFNTAEIFIPSSGDAYLGLYLNKVQIKELVSSGGGGFGALEDSDFSADDLEEYEAAADKAAGGDLDDDLEGESQDVGDDLDDDEIPF